MGWRRARRRSKGIEGRRRARRRSSLPHCRVTNTGSKAWRRGCMGWRRARRRSTLPPVTRDGSVMQSSPLPMPRAEN